MMERRERYLTLLGIPNWQLQSSENGVAESQVEIGDQSIADDDWRMSNDRRAIEQDERGVQSERSSLNRAHAGSASERRVEQLPVSEEKSAERHEQAGVDVGIYEKAALPSQSDSQQALPLNERIARCQKCHLAHHRQRAILGKGDPRRAKCIVITDTPLKIEEVRGEPLVGNAEVLFQQILSAIEMKLDQCYITAYLKCRPEELTEVTLKEKEACYPHLSEELVGVDTQIPILLLGREVSRFMLNAEKPLNQLRQQSHRLTFNGQTYTAYATYSPAELLRLPQLKGEFWRDLKWMMREED